MSDDVLFDKMSLVIIALILDLIFIGLIDSQSNSVLS